MEFRSKLNRVAEKAKKIGREVLETAKVVYVPQLPQTGDINGQMSYALGSFVALYGAATSILLFDKSPIGSGLAAATSILVYGVANTREAAKQDKFEYTPVCRIVVEY